MNTYSLSFWARCPANDMPITYRLTIRTGQMIRVEALREFADALQEGFHEDIADKLVQRFGGEQTLVAHHHGVDIETRRPWAHPWIKPSEGPTHAA